MKIKAYNPPVSDLEKTYLTDDVAAAATSLTVKNNNGFANTNKILVGEMGHERSEIATVNSAVSSGDTLPVAAVTFPHNADDPVRLLEYDKIRIYRSTAGVNGTYSLLATVDIDVDNANKLTIYDDTSGLSTYYYKISYYNSVSTAESNQSDPISGAGLVASTAGDVIDRVVRRVKDPKYTVLSVQEYLDIIHNVNDDIITQSHKPFRFLKVSDTLSTTAGQNYVDLSGLDPAMWKFDFVRYSYTVGGVTRKYRLNMISLEEWIDKYQYSTWSNNDRIIDAAIDETNDRLMIGPAPANNGTNVLEFFYFKNFTRVDSVGDYLETPTTSIYEYAMRAEYYNIKAEDEKAFLQLAQKYETKYGNELVKLQRTNRIDAGTPRSMKPPMSARRRRYYL